MVDLVDLEVVLIGLSVQEHKVALNIPHGSCVKLEDVPVSLCTIVEHIEE